MLFICPDLALWIARLEVLDTGAVSLAGSGAALVSTFWFWLVRANKERPDLRCYAVRPLSGNWPYAASSKEDERYFVARYQLDMAVANYSSLPNAVIGYRVQAMAKNGEWRNMKVIAHETALPVNVSPMTTQGVTVSGDVDISGPLPDRTGNTLEFLASPPRFRVELVGLGEKTFRTELTMPTED